MENFFSKLSFKFAIFLLLNLFVSLFFLVFFISKWQREFYLNNYRNLALSIANSFDVTISKKEDLEDLDRLYSNILKILYLVPSVDSITINLEKEGKLVPVVSNQGFLVQKEPSNEAKEVFLSGQPKSKFIQKTKITPPLLIVTSPIHYGGKIVGTYEITLNLHSLEKTIVKHRNLLLLLVTSFGFFLILVFNLFFKIQISDPLLELTKAFKQIGRGNLEYQIPTKKKDEFGEAFLGFNRMAKSLKENYEKLREIQKDLEKKVKKRTLELEEAKTVLEIKVAARTRQLKELADELKQRVEERTKELQERVQELEKMRRALLNILEDLREETERAETEKRKTLAIVENFTDGILVLDKEDRIVLCNPQAETMLQIKRTEVQNEFFKKIRENFCFKKITEIAGENLRPISRQELALREDLIVEVSIIPLFFEGQQIGKIIILHDITREKTIEKIKTEFVSISAHQLRTPLSAIKWSLRMLLDGDLGSLSKEQREFLEKTYQANQRLINLVNDLLDVTRIEEGRYLFRLEPLDFEKLATNICEIYKKEAEKKNIKFEFFVKKKSSLFIKGDSEKINLAMQNLIENAIKYTLPGGKVEVRLEEKEKEILFSVKDTGIGIPENQKHRIFSKFFRGSNVQTLDTEGTGLGLFITKNIIEAHGGKIWFESKENVGTTFYFTLPLIEKKSKMKIWKKPLKL